MAFKQLHLEYCASILVRLLSGLSNKLEFTDAFSIKTVINLPKSSPYSGDHHRYTQALIPLYKYLFNIGPKHIDPRKCFHWVATIMTSEETVSLICLS